MFSFIDIKNQKGQASRLLLVLAVVVFVAVIITYLIMRMAERPPSPNIPTDPIEPQPIYEVQLGNIVFNFQSALDRGGVLRTSEVINNIYASSYLKNLTISNPGAKFIQVTIGAQNKGTQNTENGAWGIENIVDSEGRNFQPSEGYTVAPWLPNPDFCGTLLKPAFDPVPCVKIYEVSKESTDLKIRVITGVGNTSSSLSSGKIDSALIDLIIK